MLGTQTSNPKKPTDYLATYGLWLGTAILAVYLIALVPDIVMSIYAWLLVFIGRTVQVRSAFEAAALGQGATILMAIIAIAIIVGGFEYHRKHVGETRSLKVLGWTLGIQLLTLVIGFVL
jgi:hypothetical protein